MSNAAFTPTHAAPPGGMQTWSRPDPSAAPDNQLGGGLPVQLLEETIGWGHVRCSNGWECWVDARLLVALPAPASQPVAPAPAPPYAPLPAPPVPQPVDATPAPAAPAAPTPIEITPAVAPAPAPVPVPAPAPAPAPAPVEAPVEVIPPPEPEPAPVPPPPEPVPPPPEPAPSPPVEPAAPPAPVTLFHATHRAPATGLATREKPDPGKRPNNRIEPGLELQVIERAGDWARIRCSNGWETWVDGRYLDTV